MYEDNTICCNSIVNENICFRRGGNASDTVHKYLQINQQYNNQQYQQQQQHQQQYDQQYNN
jgi:hypothetical protein